MPIGGDKPSIGIQIMRWTAACSFLVFAACCTSAIAVEFPSALDVFQQRIAPILSAKNPSSCSECHLSGVDLKQYIHADQTQTFAALRAAGLIDVRQPRESKLLKFIARKPEKPSLITDKIRQQEYDAFTAWIELAVKDPKLAAAKADVKLGSELPVEVLRHARKDQVLQSFVDNVWSEVGRCAGCHSPDRNQEQVKKNGEHISWIKLRDPQATLDHLLEHELIDTTSPEKSLLLLKPTNQVKHGGGVKMVVGDRTYKQFRAFIEDYAANQKGKYKAVSDLPTRSMEFSTVSDIWFKLTDIPADLDQLVLQVDIYPWDAERQAWSGTRIATADRQIAGKLKLWQNHLSLTAPRDSVLATQMASKPQLPAGKYLAKIYVDRDNNLVKKYPYTLSEAELVGEVELNSRWPGSYGQMTVVKYPTN